MKRFKFVFIGVGILLCMGYLVVSAIQATGVPYKHIRELPAIDSSSEPMEVKVTGKVKEGTLNYNPHEPRIEFHAEGPEGDSVRVIYEGLKPDAMVEGSHVILEGPYDPSEDVLRASSLLAKCPSRYKTEYSSGDKPSPAPATNTAN